MKLLLFTIPLLLSCQRTLGQDSIPVEREHWNDTPVSKLDSAFHSIANVIFISLDEGFDDSLVVTVNDTLIFSKYLKTNESIGYAGGFAIHFKDSSETNFLKLRFVNANRYIEEKINLKYKSLQIRGLDPWLLIYTNRFYMRE